MVFANTTTMPANSYLLVYLSNATGPGYNKGKTVTIRDATGTLDFFSTKQIVVSTTAGALFGDGTSTFTLTQPYGFLTTVVQDSATWYIANSSGFADGSNTYSPQNLSVSTINAGNATITNLNASGLLYVNSNLFTSTVYSRGFYIGNPLIPLYSTGVQNLVNSNWFYIDGNLYNSGDFQSQGSATLLGDLTVQGDARFTSPVTFEGIVNYSNAIVNYSSINADVTTITGGSITVTEYISTNYLYSSDTLFTEDLTVGSSTITEELLSQNVTTVSTLTLINPNISIGTTALYTDFSGLHISAGVHTPAINTSNISVYNTATVDTLQINTAILVQTLQDFQMFSTAISNVNGSLTIQDISAVTIRVTDLSSQTITASNMTVSTLSASTVTASTIITDFLSTTTLSMNTLYAGTATITDLSSITLTASNVFITGSLNLSAIPSYLDLSNTAISNQNSSLTASNIVTNTMTTSSLITSSMSVTAQLFQLNCPSTIIDNVYVSSLNTDYLQAGTMNVNQLYSGVTPPAVNSNYLSFNDLTTSNIIYGGDGSQFSPNYASSSLAGAAGTCRYTTGVLSNINTQPSSNVTLKLQYTFQSGGDTTSRFSYTIFTSPSTSNVYTFLGSAGNNTATVTHTIYGAVTNCFSWTMTTAGRANICVFAYVTDANYPPLTVNTSNGIFFNNGIIKWNYALNAVTIDNPYNDMLIKNINYYGALSFFSDPALKEDVQNADLNRCGEIIQDLPLRYYKYKDSYLKEYDVHDKHRLGFLADEVAQYFPHAVKPAQIRLDGAESEFMTVDFQQIKMAHIGATKQLMARIAALEKMLYG